MLIKIILVTLLLFVTFNLFRALYIMIKNDDQAPKMSLFLGRLFFSALVLAILIALMLAGVITPNPRPY